MNALLTISHERGQFQITTIGVPGPRPRFADLLVAMRARPDVPADDPTAFALDFSVLVGSAGQAALAQRLRELADAVAMKPAPGAAGLATFTLALGDLVQAPPEPAGAA